MGGLFEILNWGFGTTGPGRGIYMRKLVIAAAALCSCYAVYVLVTSGVINTLLLACGFALFAVVYAVFYKQLIRLKWLTCAIIAGAVLYAALAVFLALYGRTANAAYDEDAVVVLGAGLRGESPSLVLKNRLDAAAGYHKANPRAIIIVSGGKGSKDTIPASQVMARYLMEVGVPEDKIIEEDRSASTFENIKFSAEILAERFPEGCKTVVITSDFHIYRAVRFMEMAGLGGARVYADTPLHLLPGSLVRECAAVVKLWLFKV
jgi:uncharacterized SAM-binding protein YcdF (DUF218 family)